MRPTTVHLAWDRPETGGPEPGRPQPGRPEPGRPEPGRPNPGEDPAVVAHEERMLPIGAGRFGELVDDALDGIPEALWEQFDNVAVVVEDQHPEEPDLLGLYEGVPLTDRDFYSGELPDRIAIYRLPLCAFVDDEASLVDEIRITVVHELAHHMGIDDEALHEMGWA